MSYSLETVYEVWNDKSGEHIEVGPDRDSLGLVEIRSITDDSKLGASITMTREQAVLVHAALGKMLAETA